MSRGRSFRSIRFIWFWSTWIIINLIFTQLSVQHPWKRESTSRDTCYKYSWLRNKEKKYDTWKRLSALRAGKTYLSIYGRGVFVFNYDDDSKNFVLMSHSVPRLVHLFYTISHIYSNIHVTITWSSCHVSEYYWEDWLQLIITNMHN